MRVSNAGALALILVLVACAGAPSSPATARPTESATAATAGLVPLSIRTRQGARHFRVEVARSEAEQARGLMFRTALAPDGGMIFPFAPPRPASFWMRNTVIPLDMIFVRADGTIARIAANTVPYSLDPVESGEPVAAVFEIGGGRAAALGIAPGDVVRWPG